MSTENSPAIDTGPEAAIHDKLDEDIALLSSALDDALGELGGDDGRAAFRTLRADAEALRAGTLEGGRDSFAARYADLDLGRLDQVSRVSALWFHLVNKAEEQHRIRVLRARDHAGNVVAGSIAHGCEKLRDAGLSPDDVRALLARLFVMPVLTAHPTEARRRTILEHLEVIARVLDTIDRNPLGASERAGVQGELANTITSLLGTELSRATKPTPRDELQSGLDVFETSLLDVTPRVYRALEAALERTYPGESFELPPFLVWGSWIGGDRDGNPFVTHDVTRQALERQRTLVLRRYLEDIQHLIRHLSVSSRRVEDSARAGLAALHDSIAIDRDQLPEVAGRAQRYTVFEPWREKLWYMRARLQATLERSEAAYANVDRYLEDLQLIRDSLQKCGYGRLTTGHLHDSIRRAEVFGFHLASLDLRQHSAVHERAVAELLVTYGVTGYQDMDEDDKQHVLGDMLGRADLTPPTRLADLSPETREILATLDMVGRARRELGPRACERYIVSFTRSPSDLLEVLFLIRAARLSPGELRPVPLLEQLEDLDRAGPITETMLSSRPIRAALGGELEVMIGYSDAGKQIGYFASAVALRRAQLALARVAERHDVTLTIFHGRGGAIGRGGGPANQAIRAQPPAAVRGRIRVTEQGETITVRYSRSDIALRDLEQMVNAVLVAAAEERTQTPEDELERRNQLLDSASEKAKASYTALLEDPDRLARYALTATPIQQITKLPIGSRPASRRPGLSFDDLRAIPWVFSWNQSRHGLPGWFGLGSALDTIIDENGIDHARELYRTSSFVRGLINNAQLALSRADIDVARCYAQLADEDARQIFELIEREHSLTVGHLLDVIGGQQILGNRPHVLATIVRRNPVVDVLSHSQIELLRRLTRTQHEGSDRGRDDSIDDVQATIERIRRVLFVTINGIAAGLQTAG